jgi:cation diffusion facilitator CzcD-associated flavoprotein CzcO
MQPEIHEYFDNVAKKYNIHKHVRFQSQVESATWEDASGTWLVTIRDFQSSQLIHRRCKILISAVGALSVPKKCELPGVASFQGRVFHTAEWDHSFDWKNKEMVIIGTPSYIELQKNEIKII